MNILILGGTGAMGTYLQRLLDDGQNKITITSRKQHVSERANILYEQGNAKELDFLSRLLQDEFDAIIDFMAYSTEEFSQRYQLFLNATKQYIFISSARVYAQSDAPITEHTPRLLDVCKDQEYLNTDEYALAKARCEDLLNRSGKKNYTIIRPSITYGPERLQLGVLEKENWLYRALHGRSIVFSEDIASKLTATTIGEDVAKGIAAITGQESARGEAFHITCETPHTWQEILQYYLETLKKCGLNPKVVMTPKSLNLKLPGRKYQVIYCRYFNRRFDNSKIKKYLDVSAFTQPKDGLQECLQEFLKHPKFAIIDWRLEALNDLAAHERTPLSEIPSLKSKLLYLSYRYHFEWLVLAMQSGKKLLKRGKQ